MFISQDCLPLTKNFEVIAQNWATHIRDFFSRSRENLNPFLLPEGQTKEKIASNRLLARTLGQFAG